MTTPEAPIRVLLVEDSDVYRESLAFLLGSRADVQVVGAVADGASALRAQRELRSDVVILDYRLPDVDGAWFGLAASSAGAALVRKDEGIGALVRAVHAAVGR